MTCEEFLLSIAEANPTGIVTDSEALASLRHSRECPSCKAKAVAALKRLGMSEEEEQWRREMAYARLRHHLATDPEAV